MAAKPEKRKHLHANLGKGDVFPPCNRVASIFRSSFLCSLFYFPCFALLLMVMQLYGTLRPSI